MTISEASIEWQIKESTVWEYIRKGYIPGLQIQDNQIHFPRIYKPYITRVPKNIKNLDIDNKIKKALNSNKFISAKILGISDERFSERMIELEKSEVVRKRDANNSNYLDTDNFVICAEDSSNVSITVNGTTNFTNNVNATAQMGLLNNTLIHN